MSNTMQKIKTSTKIVVGIALTFIAAGPIVYGISLYLGNESATTGGNTAPTVTVTLPEVPVAPPGYEYDCTDKTAAKLVPTGIATSGEFRPTPQPTEYWATSYTPLISVIDDYQAHTSKYVPGGSIVLDKKIAVRRQVGKYFSETITASFSSTYGIDSSSLSCGTNYPELYPGITITSKIIGDNKLECTISGTPQKEQTLDINFEGKTNSYTIKTPDYVCTQADITSAFYAHIPECVAGGVGAVIPGTTINKEGETLSTMKLGGFIFSDCMDGQALNKETGNCEDVRLNYSEPDNILDLTYFSNENCGNYKYRQQDPRSGNTVSFIAGCPDKRIVLGPGETKHYKYVIDHNGSLGITFIDFPNFNILLRKDRSITDQDIEKMKNAGPKNCTTQGGCSDDGLLYDKTGNLKCGNTICDTPEKIAKAVKDIFGDNTLMYLFNGYQYNNLNHYMNGSGTYYITFYNSSSKEVSFSWFGAEQIK